MSLAEMLLEWAKLEPEQCRRPTLRTIETLHRNELEVKLAGRWLTVVLLSDGGVMASGNLQDAVQDALLTDFGLFKLEGLNVEPLPKYRVTVHFPHNTDTPTRTHAASALEALLGAHLELLKQYPPHSSAKAGVED